MTDVKDTAEWISTERLEEMLARVSPPAEGWSVGLPTLDVHAALTELLASRHADAQEGGEVEPVAWQIVLPNGYEGSIFTDHETAAGVASGFRTAIVRPLYAAPSNPVVSDDRWPTREEAAQAASVLLRCNGFDLDQWGGGDIMDDAPGDALKALASLSVNPQIGSDKP